MLLLGPQGLSPQQKELLQGVKNSVLEFYVLGGNNAVSQETLNQVRDILK
jgi:hypothetical protein